MPDESDAKQILTAFPLGELEEETTGTGASKGTPGDAKCVTEILGADKNKEVRGGKIYLSVLKEN